MYIYLQNYSKILFKSISIENYRKYLLKMIDLIPSVPRMTYFIYVQPIAPKAKVLYTPGRDLKRASI